MADLTHQQYKQLRDMADGHLNLYVSVFHYDPTTGVKLNPPVVEYISHDRSDVTGRDWWKLLLADGLIALPAAGTRRCSVTLKGHRAITAYRAKETHRG